MRNGAALLRAGPAAPNGPGDRERKSFPGHIVLRVILRAGRLAREGGSGAEGADEALLRALYQEHGAAVLAYATRLTGDATAAQDVLQETLIRAWRHPEALAADRGPVRPWLFTVANRIIIDRARHNAARPREVAEDPARPPLQRDHADRLVESLRVYEAMRVLSEPQRAVVVEVYFQGRAISEAAAALGIPEGTAKSRLYHALRRLREHLGDQRVPVGHTGGQPEREVTA
ncbi:MAG: sigma-70 family RNA polymerase sigma factor [Pseudonocardia sp.]|nr:sigma-70 family RNA polymerase sigma factor [Pseudonocardia sp.]